VVNAAFSVTKSAGGVAGRVETMIEILWHINLNIC
jgi:hypothetical protein